jgi:hypothetical protein
VRNRPAQTYLIAYSSAKAPKTAATTQVTTGAIPKLATNAKMTANTSARAPPTMSGLR